MADDAPPRHPAVIETKPPEARHGGLRDTMLAVILVILVGWALHATGLVSALLAAALFAALAVSPIDAWVARKVPEKVAWLGHLAALLTMIAVLAAFAAGLYFAAQRVATGFPERPLVGLAEMVPGDMLGGDGGEGEGGGLGSLFGTGGGEAGAQPDAGAAAQGDAGGEAAAAAEAGGGALGGIANQAAADIGGLASSVALGALRIAGEALSWIVLVIFLALIMLVDAPRWRARLCRVLGDRQGRAVMEAAGMIGHQLRVFLAVRAVMGLLTALLYMGWLWIFGVDLILVWGILTFILSFVPNLGSIVSGILPTVYAFLTKDFGTAIWIGVGLTAIEQVIGNFIDPRVQGRQVSLSATVILSALLIFIWIWGVPGALLATPVMIAVVIASAHVERLRPLALTLSNATSYEELDRSITPGSR